MSLFNDADRNIRMLHGAYRKLKTYYYYNKNFIILRKNIAQFEFSTETMESSFLSMAKFLKNPHSDWAIKYLESLLSQIDFYCLPKKFENDKQTPEYTVSNTTPKDKVLRQVNFFISMPIELHIFDTLWSLLIGKIIHDNNLLSESVYANTFVKALFSYDSDADIEKEINFENNRLFNIYFYKYSLWRNLAFQKLADCYDEKQHSYLFSIDITSYFYTVQLDFKELFRDLGKHSLKKELSYTESIGLFN